MDLSYIFYQMNLAGIKTWNTPCELSSSFDTFQLYQMNDSFRHSCLYIMSEMPSSALPCSLDTVPLLILCSEVPSSIPSHAIFVKDCISVLELVNFVSQVFSLYQALQLQLVSRTPDLTHILNMVHDIFHVSAAIVGCSFNTLASSDDSISIPVSEIETAARQLMWDRDFYASQDIHGCFLQDNELALTPSASMLCYNIFVDQKYYARLLVIPSESWQTTYLQPTVNILGSQLEQYFQSINDQKYTSRKSEAFFTVIQEILEQKKITDLFPLNQYGWYQNQQYQVFYFTFNDRYPMHLGKEYLQKKLEQILNECCIIDRNHHFICLCNQSISPFLYQNQQQLVTFLREYIAKVGISNIFTDLFAFSTYLHQAELALQLGEKKDPTFWYYYFHNYTYDYVLAQSCLEFSLDELLMPALHVLLKRDHEKGSDLFHTLDVYIRTRCNGQATAKQLYIHRTTFLYRMNVIRELTGLDVQNEDIYKKLLLSFELYHCEHPL